MNNIILFCIAFLATLTTTYSQDLIVTTSLDSINCKITSIKSDYIYFSFLHNGEARNTLLPVSQVKYHQTDFYKNNGVPVEKIIGYQAPYQKLRLTVNGGFSYKTVKNFPVESSDLLGYYKKLNSGYHFSSDLAYYYKSVGIGLKYNLFKTSYSMSDFQFYESTYIYHTKYSLSDHITTSYFGPAIFYRLMNHDKNRAILMNFSLGQIDYLNKKEIKSEIIYNSLFYKDITSTYNFEIKGKTIGVIIDFGYDIGITNNLSLGFQFSIIRAMLKKYDTNIEIQPMFDDMFLNIENLNRVDFSIGLRFNI